MGLIRRQVAELGLARDELEARVRKRTRELELANVRHRTLLDRFSQVGRKSAIGEMASSLAHELKQPLGAIANYAEGCQVDFASNRRWRKSGSGSRSSWRQHSALVRSSSGFASLSPGTNFGANRSSQTKWSPRFLRS